MGAKQIWRMDADGGNPKQLTDVFRADHPGLSPDGKWIYFSFYTQDARVFVAKIPIDGGAAARVSKTSKRAGVPLISPDGKLIFYEIYEEGSAQPWQKALMSAETGEHLKIFAFQVGNFVGWGRDSNSIFHV